MDEDEQDLVTASEWDMLNHPHTVVVYDPTQDQYSTYGPYENGIIAALSLTDILERTNADGEEPARGWVAYHMSEADLASDPRS